MWSVVEVKSEEEPGGWILFLNGRNRRQFSPAPDGLATASPEMLEGLLWQSTPVHP